MVLYHKVNVGECGITFVIHPHLQRSASDSCVEDQLAGILRQCYCIQSNSTSSWKEPPVEYVSAGIELGIWYLYLAVCGFPEIFGTPQMDLATPTINHSASSL